MRRVWEVLLTAGWLGLTSFGGPVAHIGYFREAYVVRRRWLDEDTFAGLVALCQFLPGPASSQLGIAIGIRRAGLLGGFAAWLAFTLPSAAALILFAYGVQSLGDQTDAGWLHGLKVVAVAVVALALWGMARTLAPDKPRVTIAALAAIALLAAPGIAAQLAVIAAGGLLGLALLRPDASQAPDAGGERGVPWLAITALLAFFTLLVALPVAARLVDNGALAIADSFYRAGSLVFGGGHVVLPLLEAEVVPPGWVTKDEFIAGYGAAQAVPGPLFTFAGYLGAAMEEVAPRWLGGLVALGAIFLPSFFLVVGVLPFWERLRGLVRVRQALMGVNAAVVGLLLAALYDPVWTSAVRAPEDFALAVGAFALLAFWRVPPWAVVALAAGAGALIAVL
ncbi:MAG: chromate efflux transporter [Chloroflexota bacterium]|nr:chromate efflux transporter [Chloroflexota bacterium]MDE2884394.1 chromate efflux transporter [Chloroflexota bacterium]